MITVTHLVKTCHSCPSQWSGFTDDGREVYVRYRWGRLSVSFWETRETIFEAQIDPEGWDGVLSLDELKLATAGVIQWPDDDSPPQEGDDRE